jgi:urease accessory protein UreH
MTARAQRPPSERRLQSRSRLVFDAPHGRTRLAVRDLGAPLRVMRGFPLKDGRLLVQIISAAPGFFAGDRYELTIEVGAGARAVILTPAATKIHSMPDGGRAEQRIRARVEPGGSLEVYPTLSIPFRDSEFWQQVEVEISESARFGWLEPWSFGRIAGGERNQFRGIATRLRIDRDGKPLCRDALDLTPAAANPAAWGLLEGAAHLLAGCWFGPCEPWAPRGTLADALVLGTVGDDGLYARGLLEDGAAFRRTVAALHAQVAQAWGLKEYCQDRFTL